MVVVTSLNPKKCLLFPAADDFGDGFCWWSSDENHLQPGNFHSHLPR